MQSTFSGIEIGKRSLLAHNRGLNTVGHNLSNASTEGYSRQRVDLQAFHPLARAQLNRPYRPGQLGQGVEVARIERVKDMLLEGRIVSQNSVDGYWTQRERFSLMVDQVYNEPGDHSVRTLMDRFWDSWQELSIYPEQTAAREQVRERGEALIDGIRQRNRSLNEIRAMLEDEIRGKVREVNELGHEIAELNLEITKSKAAGDNPNDLLDRRDLLVEKLSELLEVTIETRNPNEFTVHTGGYRLVQGGIVREFEAIPEPANNGFSRVVWGHSGEDVALRSGALGALVELRDEDLRGELQSLDNMTINFIDLVNDIHRDGFGLDGETGRDFFTEYPAVLNVLGNYDRSGDGAFDHTYLFRITGTNALDAQQQIGIDGTMTLSGPENTIDIPYNPTDTVEDVIARINTSGAEVTARLDRDDRLSLKATAAADIENPDFVIRHVEDSGQFLAGYAGLLVGPGADSAFTFDQPDMTAALIADAGFQVAPLNNPSGWMRLNREIERDVSKIAASFGTAGRPGEPGDGSAAQEIAQLRHQPVMVGRDSTFDDYFADSAASAGLASQEARSALDTQNAIMKNLRDMRDSISGVNIDEELAQMIKFQHAYTAAARYITQVDRMLDTIINRMGV